MNLLCFEVEGRLAAVDGDRRGRAWVWQGDRWRFVPAMIGKAFADGVEVTQDEVASQFADADLAALSHSIDAAGS